jgi:hypothetical protein
MIEVEYKVKDNKCLTPCPYDREYYDGQKIMVHSVLCKECSNNGGVTEDGRVECYGEDR